MYAKRYGSLWKGLIVVLGISLADNSCWAMSSAAEPLPEALSNARFYAWGMVGTPGEISREELGARRIARDWTAEQLREGLASANAEGRLYLLCVAHRNFPDAYPELKRISGVSGDQRISAFSGNVLRKVAAGEVMAQFERSRCEALGWPIDGKTP